MPTSQEHHNHARNGISIARQMYNQHPYESGEILWGALIQAAQSKKHKDGDLTHLQHPSQIREIIGSMGLNRQNVEIRLSHIDNAVTDLHGAFYHRNSPNPAVHQRTFNQTQRLIVLLLNS